MVTTAAPVRETVEEFIARKSNPRYRPAALPKPTSLPRLSDEQFEKLYREHMAQFGRPVPEDADIFETLPTRGGRVFRAGHKPGARKIYPLAATASGRLCVAQLRAGHYEVHHIPSGLQVPLVFSQAGRQRRIGTTRCGDGWKSKRDAEHLMHALEAAEILDDSPRGITGPEMRDRLTAFLAEYSDAAASS